MNRLVNRPLIALVAIFALLATGCSGGDTRETDEVTRESIRSTETQPRRFTYVDETLDATYKVEGMFEDDFRYQAAFYIDDELVYEEVVLDDRIAVRVHDERALEMLRRPDEAEVLEGDIGGVIGDLTGEAPAEGDEPAEGETPAEGDAPAEGDGPAEGEESPEGGDVEAASQDDVTPVDGAEGEGAEGVADATDEEKVEQLLLSGVWVEDLVGAPSLQPSADTPDHGEDPVYDALTVLRYAQTAMMEGYTIDRYDPESITYRPQEDPFEPPTEDEGEVERYDYQRLYLPSRAQVNESGQQQPPSMSHLRKMALYLDEDENVVRVEERVDIARRLKDLREKYEMIPPEGLSEEEQVLWALDEINALRAKTGEDPIRFRSLSVEFEDVGEETIAVEIPSGATVASLMILRGRGSETGRPPEPPEEDETGGEEVPEPEVAPPADDENAEGAATDEGNAASDS